jgi:hypothetical protein
VAIPDLNKWALQLGKANSIMQCSGPSVVPILIGIGLLPAGSRRKPMRAVQLTAFGNPVDGLECVDIPDPDTPGPNQVLIGVEYSPINPNDLMVAQGIYAFRPSLPAVIGNEGVGKVLAVGPGVENVRLGDRVLAPPSSFTWRERMVISAGDQSRLSAAHEGRSHRRPRDRPDLRSLRQLGMTPPSLRMQARKATRSRTVIRQPSRQSWTPTTLDPHARWSLVLYADLLHSAARSWLVFLRCLSAIMARPLRN